MSLIKVMVKYNSEKQTIENFGNGRYLVYLTLSKEDGEKVIIDVLSKYLGTPANRIQLKNYGSRGEMVFEIR